MVPQKFQLVDSKCHGKIDMDYRQLLVMPNDRVQGFGVAIELNEAIELAKMIMEVAAHLAAQLPSDKEMAEMDADYREQFNVGNEF